MKIELANGITVHTHPVPPADFDLKTATDRERLRYGFRGVRLSSLSSRRGGKKSFEGVQFISSRRSSGEWTTNVII